MADEQVELVKTSTSDYPCRWCGKTPSFGCSVCASRYCSTHGQVSTAKCQDCFELQPIGDTYRFRLKDGRVVENIASIDDIELCRLLEVYNGKIKELETLIISAKRQKSAIERQLKITKGGGVTVRANIPSKPQAAKPVKADYKSLERLADMLAKNPLLAKSLLEKNKK